MSKESTESAVKENNLKAHMKDDELDEESYESPFWFWVWMGGLAVLFVAFGLYNKFNTKPETSETQSAQSPAATVSAEQPVTDQPSVTK